MDMDNEDHTNKFKNVPDNIQICNLGSSHGLYGYNYEDIDEEYICFNFALVSQTLSYDYRILKNYQDKIGDGTVVFITISYFSFFGNSEIEDKDFESKNQRYYKFLPANLIKEYNFSTDLYVAKFPSVSNSEKLINVFLGNSKDETEEYWYRTADTIDVDADANAAYERHLRENKLDENGNRIINQEEIDSLYAIINLCKSKGATPVLVTTPYLIEYTNDVKLESPDFYNDFYNIINKVTALTGVSYYDFAMDERFVYDYSLFINADHLNKEGARKFVNILIETVAMKN